MSAYRCHSYVENLSPADECGDDDAPGGAAAVSAGLLGVRMGVRGIITLASPAAKPEWVEEEEEEIQAQAQQRQGTKQQNRLMTQETEEKQLVGTRNLWFYNTIYVLLFLSNFGLNSFSAQSNVFKSCPYLRGRGQFRKWVKYTGSELADMSRKPDTQTEQMT